MPHPRPHFSLILLALTAVPVCAQGWPGYGRDPQHTGLSAAPAQSPAVIRWSTPVDLHPQLVNGDLLIHYGSPVITARNTVLVPVKTGALDGFRVDAIRGSNGKALWSFYTDYSQPAHSWALPLGVALTPGDRALAVPGAGGTIHIRRSPDSPRSAVTRLAFYGMANYNADPVAFNAAIQIDTPIGIDTAGNYYFGFVSSGAPLPGYPGGIASGLARIPANGSGGAYVPAASMVNDPNIRKVAYNCAPAFSPDGSGVYVAVNGGPSAYLVRLEAATLAHPAAALLRDVLTGAPAVVSDNGSATPTVGPDGDVYFGVLEARFGSNHDRGWLLHFSADLQAAKLAGAFGWDDTASVVPAAAVPSYAGPSSYLLLTKYNNYAGAGGDGVNKLALVDPNVGMADPVGGATVMNAFMTVTGVTPDAEFRPKFPNAVREWCVNSVAVDTATRSAMVNSEDGHVYRWDFVANALRFDVGLAPPTGEAYTPTVIGPDGAVYAINNAILHSLAAH